MVVTLRDKDIGEILEGRPQSTDPAALETFIRDTHHELIDAYYQDHMNFLTSLGITPIVLAQVKAISRCHRKVDLQEQHGLVKYLGAMLRVIDELDLGANRAPAQVFLNLADEMDSTSCWHWFKHNIVEPWHIGHTVFFHRENDRRSIKFVLAVRPTREGSISYWLHQIRRPLNRALQDDGCQAILFDHSRISVEVTISQEMSSVNRLDRRWQSLEEIALSASRKVIMVIDDEFRKLEDLFLPLMHSYHVVQAPNARDAFSKMAAGFVDLAIVDIQIGSGAMWSDTETEDYKLTGIKICEAINRKHPKTKVAILTGTRHALPDLSKLDLAFVARKPISSDKLLEKVNHVLC